MWRSWDDWATPLPEVTFVVVDLETTGLSHTDCAITEIGAVKLRGGECLGELHTLVNPGVAIPSTISLLTGITDSMVGDAPAIDGVLSMFLEFLGPATVPTVVVGHSVRFDVGFLDSALGVRRYAQLRHRCVDTVGLARRLVREDVPDLRLATLARHLGVPTEPTHRALDDARATGEVLHALIELAAGYGVFALDDLVALPTIRPHPSSSKLRLTADLPRCAGVYVFRDRTGSVIRVGTADDLRTHVRSYFAGDTRRKVPQFVLETAAIEHEPIAKALDAAAREQHLLTLHEPRFNRRRKSGRRRVKVDV
jgi:DNA polymerase-3 subunit epsilon